MLNSALQMASVMWLSGISHRYTTADAKASLAVKVNTMPVKLT